MMIQMDNERSNAIGLDRDLKVVEVWSRERNGRNDKRKLKNKIFPFRMTMQNGPEGGIMLQVKEDVKADFAWSYENFA